MEEQQTLDTTTTKVDALNKHLDQRLQLDHSGNLEAEIERLANLGWTPALLGSRITARCGPQAGTGVVVHVIRGITGPPAPNQTPTAPIAMALHAFEQSPENLPGYCKCALPQANRHHHSS